MDKETLKNAFNDGTFVYGFTANLRRLLIDFYQILFKYHDLAAKYRYSDNIKETKILIGSVFPQEERIFPRLLVQVDLSEETPLAIGQSGLDGQQYFVATGRVDYEVGLVIAAQEDTVVKEIADLTLIFTIAPLFRRQLNRYGIVIKMNDGIKISNVSKVNYTPEFPVWETTIRWGFFTEWRQDFEYRGITIQGEEIVLEI